jgi:hypothetical protein
MALTDRDKRTLTIGGIVVGVLVVGFVLFSVLTGGGGPTVTPKKSPSTAAAGPPETGSPSLAPSPVLVLPARDPFSIPPGFNVASSGSSTSGGSSTGSSTSSGSGSSTSSGTGSTTTTTTAPGGPGNSSSETVGGHTVTLIDTFSTNGVERADVQVDTTVYHPSVGETFGPNGQYRLQSVSGNCASFLFGDESFTLCVAQNK